MREEKSERVRSGRFFECGSFRLTVEESGAAYIEVFRCENGKEKDWCESEILSAREVDMLTGLLVSGKPKGPIPRG